MDGWLDGWMDGWMDGTTTPARGYWWMAPNAPRGLLLTAVLHYFIVLLYFPEFSCTAQFSILPCIFPALVLEPTVGMIG